MAEVLEIPEISLAQALLWIGAGIAMAVVWIASRHRKNWMEHEPRKAPDTFAYVQVELKPEDKELFREVSRSLDKLAKATENGASKISNELRWASTTGRRSD